MVYNTLLTYKGRNDHGASIYVEKRGGYLVKIGDQPLEDEQTLWANYQGDRYISERGVTYLMTAILDDVDLTRKVPEHTHQLRDHT